MNHDFKNINLYLRERYKLCYLRWIKKEVDETYFGKESTQNLVNLHFLQARYKFSDVSKATTNNPARYHLTDIYFRYCVWRRNRFFYGTLWPQIVAGITSIIVSIVTVLIAVKLGLQ